MYEIKNYPDGTKYVNLIGFSTIETFRINSYEDLWMLGHLKDIYDFHGIKLDMVIPCLLDAQADKRFDIMQSSGLKLVCQYLNGLNFNNITIFHPHNQEVVEAYIPNVTIQDNAVFIARVFQELSEIDGGILITGNKLKDDLILLSSDAGGFKPLMKLADKLKWQGEVYGASKSRSYKNGKSQLVQVIDKQDFGGKDILIIDDICVYGGTFKGLSKMLKERNCGKLYLAVSHMSVRNLGEDPVTNYFEKVFTTNSKFNEYFADGKTGNPNVDKNLKIINLF